MLQKTLQNLTVLHMQVNATEWKWSFCHIYSFQHLFTFQIGTKGQSTLCLTEIIKHFDSEILN